MTASDTYTLLREFLTDHMRMSHIYQPVMLKVLIEGNGKADLRSIAAAFLAHDQAQLEYYEEITKRMPGRVLQNHGLVQREGDGYRLTLPLSDLTDRQRDELIRICDAKVDDYLQRRGVRAYDHRRMALGELSGALRYQVLAGQASGANYAVFLLMSKLWRWTTSFLVATGVRTRRRTFRPYVGAAMPTKEPETLPTSGLFVRLWPSENQNAPSAASTLRASLARMAWR